jgi:hypothetical protein
MMMIIGMYYNGHVATSISTDCSRLEVNPEIAEDVAIYLCEEKQFSMYDLHEIVVIDVVDGVPGVIKTYLSGQHFNLSSSEENEENEENEEEYDLINSAQRINFTRLGRAFGADPKELLKLWYDHNSPSLEDFHQVITEKLVTEKLVTEDCEG